MTPHDRKRTRATLPHSRFDWQDALHTHRATHAHGHAGRMCLRTHAPDVLRACARMARTNHMSEE